MDYIKLSSKEIADEIASMSKKENDMWWDCNVLAIWMLMAVVRIYPLQLLL